VAYPNGYLYLTAHWTVTGTTEIGQFGLKFDTTAPASTALVTAAAARLATMWSSASMLINPQYSLVYARLAAIGTDGKYIPDSSSFDYTYTTPVTGTGGGPSSLFYPLQTAHVMTLRTAIPRGRAHVGRVYLPPIHQNLSSAFQWTASMVSTRNNTFAAMLSGMNSDMPGPVTVFSKIGAGYKHAVTYVNSDTRPDVQRRRANQQGGALGVAANV
jgi:hypothetical protein